MRPPSPWLSVNRSSIGQVTTSRQEKAGQICHGGHLEKRALPGKAVVRCATAVTTRGRALEPAARSDYPGGRLPSQRLVAILRRLGRLVRRPPQWLWLMLLVAA